jgi:hypothetical protein
MDLASLGIAISEQITKKVMLFSQYRGKSSAFDAPYAKVNGLLSMVPYLVGFTPCL